MDSVEQSVAMQDMSAREQYIYDLHCKIAKLKTVIEWQKMAIDEREKTITALESELEASKNMTGIIADSHTDNYLNEEIRRLNHVRLGLEREKVKLKAQIAEMVPFDIFCETSVAISCRSNDGCCECEGETRQNCPLLQESDNAET